MNSWVMIALKSANSLIELIRSKSGTHDKKSVELIIYFDESHSLTLITPNGDNRHNSTCHQILCSVINSFQTLDLFVLFLSTNSKITSYSPSHAFWSLKEGQTPFNELPFDQWKEPHLLKANAHTLKEVCAPGFMVRFGRPL